MQFFISCAVCSGTIIVSANWDQKRKSTRQKTLNVIEGIGNAYSILCKYFLVAILFVLFDVSYLSISGQSTERIRDGRNG
jgi:NADH:ubiquinone oxidoreductase subunit 3 (subunit A)